MDGAISITNESMDRDPLSTISRTLIFQAEFYRSDIQHFWADHCQWKQGKEGMKWTKLIKVKCISNSLLHLHITNCRYRRVVHEWVPYYPVIHIELEGRMRGSCNDFMTQRSNLQSGNKRQVIDRLLGSNVLQMRSHILGAECTPSSWVPVTTVACLVHRPWFIWNQSSITFLDRILVNPVGVSNIRLFSSHFDGNVSAAWRWCVGIP